MSEPSMFELTYNTPVRELSLTDLHRVIKHAQRRQAKVAWLHHRAARLRVLRAERTRRMAAIADRWAAR